MGHIQLVLGGEAVKIDRHQEIRNPSTGDVVGLMPLATEADLDTAVRKAAAAFATRIRPMDAPHRGNGATGGSTAGRA
jgi:acyl-CoA reductase-like NAD-dependent aldehyde dehydrogenase